MCLILLAWQAHPDYRLIVAANRDEFFARPTAPAHFWPSAPPLLAGKDLSAGGTWLGVTRSGRFAALTNYRDPRKARSGLASRGALVTDFLTGNSDLAGYLQEVQKSGDRYNGFNLLAATDDQLAYCSNVTGEARWLSPGIYGLSNHLLDTPWPKVTTSKSALSQALTRLPEDADLMRLLGNCHIYPDSQLPDTGVGADWERLLSAAFVRSPGYGTRCSTTLTIDRQGLTRFDEQTWQAGAQHGTRRRFSFKTVSE